MHSLRPRVSKPSLVSESRHCVIKRMNFVLECSVGTTDEQRRRNDEYELFAETELPREAWLVICLYPL